LTSELNQFIRPSGFQVSRIKNQGPTATQQDSRTQDQDYQDLQIDHLHYWLKSRRPRAKKHGQRAKKQRPTTECEEDQRRAKKQWPIADEQRISKAKRRRAKKQ